MSKCEFSAQCKSCPFCGSSNIYIGRGGTGQPVPDSCGTWGYVAGCKDCGVLVQGPGLPREFHKIPGSIKNDYPIAMLKTLNKWNARAQ